MGGRPGDWNPLVWGIETGAPTYPSFRIATICGSVNQFLTSVFSSENELSQAQIGPASGGQVRPYSVY
jgi:hypothetical protein